VTIGSDYPPNEIEQAFIREFSTRGDQIGKSVNKADRRERVRRAIHVNGRASLRFHDSAMNYAEAFQSCYGERLDRRAATRTVPEDNEDPFDDEDEDDLGDDMYEPEPPGAVRSRSSRKDNP
jgi:hypothetical protein